MSSNSIALVDREIVSGHIEGVDFGPKLWVVARSPTAVLIWVFGHSWSVNGNRSYSEPHLTILPDRTPRFMFNPTYKSLSPAGRLTVGLIERYRPQIELAFADAYDAICGAVKDRRTVLIEGGGGSLLPLNCRGDAYREWKAAGGGFIVRPEGVSEWDTMKGKLGWSPK